MSTMIPEEDKPFLLDLWDKTKHLCGLCLCFIACLILIYLLFLIFSGGVQTGGQLSIESIGILETPTVIKR